MNLEQYLHEWNGEKDMTNVKIDDTLLSKYDKILVYGAGAAGSVFLRFLSTISFDKNKVVVWDMKWEKIKYRHGFKVTMPDFDNKIGNNTLVVIALMGSENAPLANELQKKFLDEGYKNVIFFSETFGLKVMYENEFEGKEGYADFTYQEDIDFSHMTSLVKPIAFYLPQFHEIPENDEWWGKGFTEWVNVKKARPRYKGHYQPREPHDYLGYYDLSDVDVIRKQANLAKSHGIYGWSMYYYWFSGKTLLTKPIDLLLENKDIDIKFCLTWCNHSWTKSWVGDSQKELIKCEYLPNDPEKFIDDIKKYMVDDRYIKIDGKPLISVYWVHEMPNAKDIVARWRKRAIEIGIGDLFILSLIKPYTLSEMGLQDVFDAETEFASWQYALFSGRVTQLKSIDEILVARLITYYSDLVKYYKHVIEMGDYKSYLSCLGGFDNTPRYETNSSIHDFQFSLKDYYDMVKFVTEETIARGREFMFVFAWNEWAESVYLEPDKKFGYALINTFSKALHGLPLQYSKGECND